MKTRLVLICLALILIPLVAVAQSIKYQRAKFQDVIKVITSEVKKVYFDENFNGIDLEEKSKAAIELVKAANTETEMMAIIANFLIEFDDSHLFYIPPIKVSDTDYGWEMSMVGDKCFVTDVSSDSDAEKQGLRKGDEIYIIQGFIPTRENLWKINYYYRALNPHPALSVIAIKPDGKKIQYILKAKITEGRSVYGVSIDDWKFFDWRLDSLSRKIDRHVVYTGIEGLVVWKMPRFDLSPDKVDDVFSKLNADDSLIIDLRGNGGGKVYTTLRTIGNVFSEDTIVGTRKSRKDTKDEIAKSRGKKSFKGKLAVLIDSDSASASEVFAKLIQLEKRGVVYGDVSAGMVMESQISSYKDSTGLYSVYGLSITVADLIMKDGKSLEKNGVLPDEKILPTAHDLAENRDPVLARAMELFGFKITPEQAGRIFVLEYDN
jgi:C-terminal processing protease CtpA/Prc